MKIKFVIILLFATPQILSMRLSQEALNKQKEKDDLGWATRRLKIAERQIEEESAKSKRRENCLIQALNQPTQKPTRIAMKADELAAYKGGQITFYGYLEEEGRFRNKTTEASITITAEGRVMTKLMAPETKWAGPFVLKAFLTIGATFVGAMTYLKNG